MLLNYKIITNIVRLITIPIEIIFNVVLNPKTFFAINPTQSFPVPQAMLIIAPIYPI